MKLNRLTRPPELFLCIVCMCFVLTCILPAGANALIGIEEGDAPVKVVLEDLDGNTVNAAEFFGEKPVILVFWELPLDRAFLDYSLDELRFLNEYYKKYHEAYGLEIFAIYTPMEEKKIPLSEIVKVKNLINSNRIQFPVLIDRGFRTFREYGVIALPSTIMVDRTGIIKFIYPGFPLSALQLFAEQIDELVGITVADRQDDGDKEKADSHSKRLYRYALRMARRGLLEQAMSPLKKSLALDYENTWSHNLMGIILWKNGDFEGAFKEFKKAIELDKNNAAAHFNYGLLLSENEKYGLAEKHFSKAVEVNGRTADGHYVLGMLYMNTGRHEKAAAELKKALELYGSGKLKKDPPGIRKISALYALAEIYFKRGNEKEAQALLRKAAQTALGIDEGYSEKLLYRSKDLMIYE